MIYIFLSELNIRNAMWIIPIIFFLHEMEEWKILDWYHSTYNPPPKSTKLSCRIWLFIISIWFYFMTVISHAIPDKQISAGVLLFLIVFSTFNGIQHVFWQFAFKKYAPGVIFSSLGIVAGAILIAACLFQNLVSPVYVIILYAITIFPLIITFKAGNKCIKLFYGIHNLSLKIVEVLSK